MLTFAACYALFAVEQTVFQVDPGSVLMCAVALTVGLAGGIGTAAKMMIGYQKTKDRVLDYKFNEIYKTFERLVTDGQNKDVKHDQEFQTLYNNLIGVIRDTVGTIREHSTVMNEIKTALVGLSDRVGKLEVKRPPSERGGS